MTPISAIRRSGAGFTLLELMIVLAILAMGSVLLIPSIGNMSSRTFTAQVREVNALLNYTRRTAVVTGQPAYVRFFPAQDEEEDTPPTSAETTESSLNRGERWQARGIELAYEDSTELQRDVEDGITVAFFPEGGSTGGSLILSLNEREAVISIDPFSGKVVTEYPDD